MGEGGIRQESAVSLRDVSPLEFLVAAWVVVFGLVILACIIASIVDFHRDPPDWWVRRQIPDTYDPDDWQPKRGDAKANRP
jgi:hypothetical protein